MIDLGSDAQPPHGQDALGSSPPRPPAVRFTILIVEDDPGVADTMARTLAARGWVPSVAASAVQALRLARREPFSLAVVDVGLGGELDGVDVAEWLAQLYDTPIVFATATIDEDVLVRAAAIRPAGYLVKPIEPEQLYSAVVLAGQRALAARTPGLDRTPNGVDTVFLRRKMEQIRDLVDEVRLARQARAKHPDRLPSGIEDLSSREWQIMRDLAATPSVEAIARRRHLSVHTVQNHLKSIFRKLEVHSTAELLSLLLSDK